MFLEVPTRHPWFCLLVCKSPLLLWLLRGQRAGPCGQACPALATRAVCPGCVLWRLPSGKADGTGDRTEGHRFPAHSAVTQSCHTALSRRAVSLRPACSVSSLQPVRRRRAGLGKLSLLSKKRYGVFLESVAEGCISLKVWRSGFP